MNEYNTQGSYPPPYQPYQPAPQPGNNALGIIGFIFSLIGLFFGWFPLFGQLALVGGLILSVIGLFFPGRALAVAGLIISIISIIGYGLIVIFIIGLANLGPDYYLYY
ncbi:MAG: hypothetical protein NC111_06660 [Bacteroides sp.]|nr:hypothetical protein [Bacteroides sp.]MCM1413795.1 hypothetical protein [Bacteroides sp.]MCM1472186.1 hypothetical protein [Bacteroides sp.]